MAIVDLIIDVGSSNICIYKEGGSVSLSEPNIIFFKGDKLTVKNIDCFGSEAKDKITKVTYGYTAVAPVCDGGVVYKKALTAVMAKYIARVVNRNDYFFKPTIRAFVSVPCGYKMAEREALEEVLIAAGISQVFLVDSPQMQAFSISGGVSDDYPVFVCDIGGDLTNVGLVSPNYIKCGASYSIGGNNIDVGIVDGLQSSISLKVGLITAGAIKEKIGSLLSNEVSSINVYGKNMVTGNPRSATIDTDNIRPMLDYFYNKIGDIVSFSLSGLSDEELNSVSRRGVHFVGGGSMIYGLKEFMERKLGIPVCVQSKPNLATIRGGEYLLSNAEVFDKILKINLM